MPVEVTLSVLASGQIVLNGKPVAPAEFESDIVRTKQGSPDCVVLYYRENALGPPAPESLAVIKTLLKHKVSVSVCSKPDFSDFVDRFGQSRPRAELDTLSDVFRPHLPDVFVDSDAIDLDAVFNGARQLAANDDEKRGLVIVRPDRGTVVFPQTAERRQTLSGVAVIANTALTLRNPSEDILRDDLARALPFLDPLEHLFREGHPVWIFEGHRDALAAACRGAETLLVDGALLPFLAPDWTSICETALGQGSIQVYERETRQFAKLERARPRRIG